MRTSHLYLLLAATCLLMVESSAHDIFSRWRRQAIHCQAGDEACKKCSSNCDSVETSNLPECCEAYNACCDDYFQACKKCSSIVSKDRYFPEYCCASFTDCCELITTFTVDVRPPAPVRSKPKPSLKIPEVAAPKPTSFPGAAPVSLTNLDESIPQRPNLFKDAEFAPEPVFPSQGPPPLPQESVFASQRPKTFEPSDSRPREPVFPQRASEPRQPTSVGVAPAAAPPTDNSRRQRTRTQARAQGRPQNRGQQQNNRQRNQGGLDLSARRGRVTSRGRIAA